MALKATIFKAELQIADRRRQHDHDHALTLARHPSETDERMMVRLLAFALHADAALVFGRGLSADDEPDLWRKDLTGVIELWIEVGLPDVKRVRQAAGRAAEVFVYTYGGRAADRWWDQAGDALERVKNLTVINLPQAGSAALAGMAQRGMRLAIAIDDGRIGVSDGQVEVEIVPLALKLQARTMRGR